MAQSEAAKRASAKYDKANTIAFMVKLNKKTDADIIEFFEHLDTSRMGFIKDAIREKMSREDTGVYLLNTDTPEAWGSDAYNGMKITLSELLELANDWGVPVGDLLKQVEREG